MTDIEEIPYMEFFWKLEYKHVRDFLEMVDQWEEASNQSRNNAVVSMHDGKIRIRMPV